MEDKDENGARGESGLFCSPESDTGRTEGRFFENFSRNLEFGPKFNVVNWDL